MRLGQLLANWPWVVAYIVASAIVFVCLRRRSSTDEQAAQSQHANDGFGAAKSLSLIAAAFFRLTCPQLLLLLVAAAWVVRFFVGQWNLWDAAVVLGVLAFWPIQEWLIHVFLLHLKPFTLLGRRIDPIISRNHRNHHNNPWDPVLGVTPPHVIWLYVAGIPGLWSLAMPIPQAITGVAVYFCLVLNYEWVHYLIHTSYTPRTWFYKRLWLNHRLHHFKNEQYWYGVTMLSGDRLLGTQPAVAEAARSETCLTLGHVDDEGHPAAAAAGARSSRRRWRPWPTAVRNRAWLSRLDPRRYSLIAANGCWWQSMAVSRAIVAQSCSKGRLFGPRPKGDSMSMPASSIPNMPNDTTATASGAAKPILAISTRGSVIR